MHLEIKHKTFTFSAAILEQNTRLGSLFLWLAAMELPATQELLFGSDDELEGEIDKTTPPESPERMPAQKDWPQPQLSLDKSC